MNEKTYKYTIVSLQYRINLLRMLQFWITKHPLPDHAYITLCNAQI